ncbi:MAG: ParB/RepB/Spo0J family partition protein [Bacillota bacterium]|jgi:ParB family chromosome partitioning protein|nr:ParB/RepB/Spo0J family partition protein [Bacillota bacterium]MDD3298022.1 ParB/RepB/Spo0J family partition protein [Bacillota bacterium]MDD3850053.1 ParB/RepB/Spo0J family partition protein [Bacillota bacterium]MDD4706710.1 ParB/RepB/Spo0J family partition protein [Bacillota bacterium]
MAKKRLGKGLNALIPELPQIEDQGIQEVPVNDIAPNRNQPRQQFDAEKMEGLAESISKHGVVQPIAVRKIDQGFEIVAGERRWRAARMAGLKTVPAVVMELDERQIVEIALVENLQREDLNPIEEAEAYKTLMEEFELTQDDISAAVGKSRPAIANTLRLLSLSADIQRMVRDNLLTAGHARALITLEGNKQKEVIERILKEDLSVRETEKVISSMAKEKRSKTEAKAKNPWVMEMEGIMGEFLGTKVQIVQGKKKGKIEIEYYNAEDLERILELLKG